MRNRIPFAGPYCAALLAINGAAFAAETPPVRDLVFIDISGPNVDKTVSDDGVGNAVYRLGYEDYRKVSEASIDLNGDGSNEAFVKITHGSTCAEDNETCDIVVMRRNSDGAGEKVGGPIRAKVVALLDGASEGYRNIAFDGRVYGWSQGAYLPKP